MAMALALSSFAPPWSSALEHLLRPCLPQPEVLLVRVVLAFGSSADAAFFRLRLRVFLPATTSLASGEAPVTFLASLAAFLASVPLSRMSWHLLQPH
jgi:hypothetical protein